MATWLRVIPLLLVGCSASPGGAPGGGAHETGGETSSIGGGGGAPMGTGGSVTGPPPVGGAAVGGSGGTTVVEPMGGAPAGGHAGAGGSKVADLPEYDPNVHFEWAEADPDALPPCLAGRYVGTFTGWYNLLIPVAGDVDMTLTESQSGEFLEVTGGSMSGTANGLIPFSADVTGQLDCTTKRFTAQLENGVYDIGGAQTAFEGPLEADYDTLTHTMTAGTWTVTEPNPANGGTGEWTATFTP